MQAQSRRHPIRSPPNLVARYAFDPKKTRWIEHLPPQDGQPGEFGERLCLEAGKAAPDPQWRQMEEMKP